MLTLNLALWAVSLTAQCGLLAVLPGRGVARRLPVFSGLLAFYILRSAGMYAFSGHLRGPVGALISSGLGVVDVLLQVGVGWELWRLARTESRGPYRARRYVGLVVIAALFAAVLPMIVHANPRAPMDRDVLFTSALFLMVASFRWGSGVRLVRVVGGGLAFWAVAGVCAQVGRAMAGARHQTAPFHAWSYVEAVTYLAVVIFWVIKLRRMQEANAPGGNVARMTRGYA